MEKGRDWISKKQTESIQLTLFKFSFICGLYQSILGISKLHLMNQMVLYLYGPWAKPVFTFLMVEKNKKKVALSQVKTTWNLNFRIHKLILLAHSHSHLLTFAYSCFCTINHSLSSCNKDQWPRKIENIYSLALLQKKSASPGLFVLSHCSYSMAL